MNKIWSVFSASVALLGASYAAAAPGFSFRVTNAIYAAQVPSSSHQTYFKFTACHTKVTSRGIPTFWGNVGVTTENNCMELLRTEPLLSKSRTAGASAQVWSQPAFLPMQAVDQAYQKLGGKLVFHVSVMQKAGWFLGRDSVLATRYFDVFWGQASKESKYVGNFGNTSLKDRISDDKDLARSTFLADLYMEPTR